MRAQRGWRVGQGVLASPRVVESRWTAPRLACRLRLIELGPVRLRVMRDKQAYRGARRGAAFYTQLYKLSRTMVRSNGSSAGTSSPVRRAAARRYIPGAPQPPAAAVSRATRRHASSNLGQVQRLGGLRHDLAPLLIELDSLLRDQGGGHAHHGPGQTRQPRSTATAGRERRQRRLDYALALSIPNASCGQSSTGERVADDEAAR